MQETLLILVPIFLITLIALKLYHTSQTFSPDQKQQIEDLKLRNTILQKKVITMLEVEKKHLECVEILNKKISELKREVIFQNQIKDQ